MARIRTIKPEFVESESVGKLSRDARLLFILLWTFVDDSGRSRASSRLLASRLFPYDDDAQAKIDGWLDELVAGGHVRLYEVDGNLYLDIPKWLNHQKIDHASKSRLPEFREGFARPRESVAPHTLDLGPRTMDLVPSEANASGADAPKVDPVKALIDDGLKLLMDTGTSEKHARSLIGGWRKAHGDEATRTAIQAAYDHGAVAPVEFIVASLTRAPKAHETWDQRRIREAMEAIQ